MQTENLPFVIVGLGNPGREYRETRHNIGFMVIDRLCKVIGISLSRVQSKALVGIGVLEGQKVILAKPQTYMNNSGQSVGGLVRFYKAPIEHLMVTYDDLDLPLGTIRLRSSGGSAGQKGMGSIIQQLATQDIARMRLGIGRPPGQMDPSDYVLHPFSKQEQPMLEQVLDRAEGAVREFIRQGVDSAMNLYNGNLLNKENQ